ncbi:MAG: C45 family peptidase [Victivallaceae bacterium]|nr:C45 family peptidase [Victivallaceae bacterium]
MKKILALLVLTGMVSLSAAGRPDTEDDVYSHECTSWLVFSDLTKNNTNILHKNRDAKYRNLMPITSPADSARKWIGLGDGSAEYVGKESVCMGMNVSGLAAVVNSGEPSVEHSYPGAKMGTPAILRAVLSGCDTAAQAVEKLRAVVTERKYSHGQKGPIFFFMDMKEAEVVEVTANRCSVQRYDHGYAFRANIWHNPDMASVADNPAPGWLNSCNRELMVMRDLNRAYRANGRITTWDILEMSRDTVTPEKSPIQRTLCSKSTNSASTLEIDLAYPDVLSTGYFLIGAPRHTICVPVPVCVGKLHPVMADLRWSTAAWASFDANGFGAELPAAWLEFEKLSLADYKKAQDEARKLLAEGKRDAAVRLLNDTAWKIWEGAAKLIGLDKPGA